MKTRIYKLVLGVFITLFAFNAYSQDYEYIPIVKPGLQLWTWDYAYYGYEDESYAFRRYALTEEDTIIDNITYKKIYEFTDLDFDPNAAEYYGGMRENSQKQVYYRAHYTDREILLYDFSLSIGDTFRTSTPSVADTVTFEVTSIDTIEYNGIYRKVFTVELGPNEYMSGVVEHTIWIEGVGNYEGITMFPRYLAVDNWYITRCYIHNDELLYSNYRHGGSDCITPLMRIEDFFCNSNYITLYPNPTTSEISISSESLINSIEIYNSLGQKVYAETINSKEKTINISSLPSGVYILGAKTEDGIMRKKIIKN